MKIVTRSRGASISGWPEPTEMAVPASYLLKFKAFGVAVTCLGLLNLLPPVIQSRGIEIIPSRGLDWSHFLCKLKNNKTGTI